MLTLCETIKRAAQRRVTTIHEVFAAAQELHDEGAITPETLLEVTALVERGNPYMAKDVLERSLAKRLLEDSACTDDAFVCPNEETT